MLTTNDIVIRFGGLTAVDHVSLHVAPNTITGLIGPNGAGKTTLFNAISGVYTPSEGSIVFNEKHIEGMRPFQINKVGMCRTYQVINLFRKMTVLENVVVGMHSELKAGFFSSVLRTKREREEEMAAYEKAYQWLEFAGIESYANDLAGSLPYGKQRLLEIVRALASNPQLVLLDEPAAGMNSAEKAEFDKLLKKIVDQGFTVLMIEHDLRLVMGVCDYVYVLEYGKLLAEGTPEEVQCNPEVIRAYLGGE